MRVLFVLIFLACAFNWFAISTAAKSAMHETTAAVVGLSALAALATTCVLEAIRNEAKNAKLRADEHRELFVSILNELNKQTVLHGKMVEMLGEQNGDAFARAVQAEEFRAKALVFLHNLDASAEHTNSLLKWIGEQGPLPGQAPQ